MYLSLSIIYILYASFCVIYGTKVLQIDTMLCYAMYLYLLLAHYAEVLPGATNLVDEMSSGFTKSEPWLKKFSDPLHQRDNQLMPQDETKK